MSSKALPSAPGRNRLHQVGGGHQVLCYVFGPGPAAALQVWTERLLSAHHHKSQEKVEIWSLPLHFII